MKKWIILQSEEVKNYLIAKENSILLAEVNFDEDVEELLNNSQLTNARTLRYEGIQEFIFIDTDNTLHIDFKDDKVDQIVFELTEDVYSDMKAHFLNTMKGVSVKDYSLLTQIQSPGIVALVSGGLTALLYNTALSLERGEYVSTSGRRGLMKKIFVAIADFLGSTGTLVVGGLITLFFLYEIFKIVRNPKEGKLIKIKDFVEMKF